MSLPPMAPGSPSSTPSCITGCFAPAGRRPVPEGMSGQACLINICHTRLRSQDRTDQRVQRVLDAWFESMLDFLRTALLAFGANDGSSLRSCQLANVGSTIASDAPRRLP